MPNFSKSLNPKDIDKSVSDIRIRFPFESSFWISVSGCKHIILPDIQPANRIVIISDIWVLFFTHIPFVVNHTFSTILTERLQQLPHDCVRLVETTESERDK